MQAASIDDEAPWPTSARSSVWRAGCDEVAQPLSVHLLDTAHAERRGAEAFLEAAYDRAFGGKILGHFPVLMCVEDRGGKVQAAVGFRQAGEHPLFLEQYLDEPVEVLIARAVGRPVSRTTVVEIGNLAAESSAASRLLFKCLGRRLHGLGCDYAVATATRQLRRTFERLRFPVHELGAADPSRLPDAGREWGAYYAHQPRVLAGAIAQALPGLSAFSEPGRFLCGPTE